MIRHLLTSVLLLLFTSIHAQVQLGQDMYSIYGQYLSTIEMPSSNVIAYGGYTNDIGSSYGGFVKLFDYQNSEWIQRGNTLLGENPGDNFGSAISIPDDNENFVAIGAMKKNGAEMNTGEVSFYTWDGTSWLESGISLQGDSVHEYFGCDTDMPNQNTIAIGAFNAYNQSGVRAGGVRVYTFDGADWVLKGNPLFGEDQSDYFGANVCMPDENTLAVSATGNNNSVGADAGKVYVFDWDGNNWILRGNEITGEYSGSTSGRSLSMPTPNTISVGEINVSSPFLGARQFRVLDWDGNEWVQRGLTFESEHDYHTISNSSMPDSNTIALGEPGYKDLLYKQGRIRLFKWDGANWIQKGADILGDSSNYDLGAHLVMPDTNRVGTTIPGFQNIIGDVIGGVNVYDFCASKSTDEVSTCNPFTWINGTTYYEPNNTDFHVLTNSEGCDSIIYLDLTFLPDAGITNNSSHLIADAENASYQWIDCDDNNTPINGETNQAFYFTENGNYAVIVTQNGCTDTSECITVSDVSVPTLSIEQVKIYPNPTDGKLYIESKELTSVKVMDAMGRVIATHATSSQSHSIDLSAHKHGVYIVQVNDSKQIRTYRVVLK